MANKRSAGNKDGSGRNHGYTEFSFINVSLSRAEKVKLSALDIAEEFPLRLILELASEGYKFSIKEDAKGGGFVAALTDGREDSISHKHILTGRGSTALNSWAALAYRHYTILEEDWSAETQKTGVPDFD